MNFIDVHEINNTVWNFVTYCNVYPHQNVKITLSLVFDGLAWGSQTLGATK